jgi:hypothetical protein
MVASTAPTKTKMNKMILNETKGAVVEQLQQKFGIDVTGVYDQPTRVAIIGWQLERGLPAHGIVDEAMWIEVFGALPVTEEPTQEEKVITKKPRKNDSEVQETES